MGWTWNGNHDQYQPMVISLVHILLVVSHDQASFEWQSLEGWYRLGATGSWSELLTLLLHHEMVGSNENPLGAVQTWPDTHFSGSSLDHNPSRDIQS